MSGRAQEVSVVPVSPRNEDIFFEDDPAERVEEAHDQGDWRVKG